MHHAALRARREAKPHKGLTGDGVSLQNMLHLSQAALDLVGEVRVRPQDVAGDAQHVLELEGGKDILKTLSQT